MDITKKQLNYLIAIRRLQHGFMSLTQISEYMDVKKPTAFMALKALEEKGYIIKEEYQDGNTYYLTDKACKVLDGFQKERFEFMALFYDRLGINRDICEKEYEALCGLLSEEFIEQLSAVRKSGDNCYKQKHDKTGEYFGIPYGTYLLPFQIIQINSERLRSMGNKGFEHPATLILSEDRQDIVLKSKRITHAARDGKKMQGELVSLSYLDNYMNWVTIEKNNENDWIIPVSSILYQRSDTGRLSFGTLKIKAVASAVIMPESTAEMTFNFKDISQK